MYHNNNFKFIKQMFSNIAYRYDLMNRILSLGLDIYWRKKMCLEILNWLNEKEYNNIFLADIASGTGDVVYYFLKLLNKYNLKLKFLKSINIYCCDCSYEMLVLAKQKIDMLFNKNNFKNVNVFYIVCDANKLCFKNEKFNIVTIAFGIRNFSDLRFFLNQELFRILIKNKNLVSILEFSNVFIENKSYLFKLLISFYYNFIIIAIAKIFIKFSFAYNYLTNSIKNFYSKYYISNLLLKNGAKTIKIKNFFPFVVNRYLIFY